MIFMRKKHDQRTDDGGRHMGNQCDRNGDWQRLYALGILTAVLIVFVQIILHRNHRWLRESYKEELSFVIDQNKEALQDLQERLKHAD